MVHSLIYRSTACYEMDVPQLDDILLRSRPYNQQHHITGLLLYANQRFMQLLEGGRHEVQHLCQRIRQDARHTDLTILLDGSQPRRLFPDWSMGFTQVEAAEFTWLDGYIDPRLRAELIPPTYDTGRVIMALLEEFVEDRAMNV